MNFKTKTFIAAMTLSLAALVMVACNKDENTEGNALPQANTQKTKSNDKDGVYIGVFERQSASPVYFMFFVKDGKLADYNAVDKNGNDALPEGAEVRGPYVESVDAYAQLIDMCIVDKYPCVIIVPTKKPDLNNGGKPKTRYYVVGSDYDKEGDCWYNKHFNNLTIQ